MPQLENYGSAIEDAEKAVSLDKSYIKGYYRCAHRLRRTHPWPWSRLLDAVPRSTPFRSSLMTTVYHCRRAEANFCLRKYKEALKDFRQARSTLSGVKRCVAGEE